jgi:hypothetical protein
MVPQSEGWWWILQLDSRPPDWAPGGAVPPGKEEGALESLGVGQPGTWRWGCYSSPHPGYLCLVGTFQLHSREEQWPSQGHTAEPRGARSPERLRVGKQMPEQSFLPDSHQGLIKRTAPPLSEPKPYNFQLVETAEKNGLTVGSGPGVLLWPVPTPLSLKDSTCEMRAGPKCSEAPGVQDPHWVGEARVWASQHLGHRQAALGVARKEAFSGSRKGWQNPGPVRETTMDPCVEV